MKKKAEKGALALPGFAPGREMQKAQRELSRIAPAGIWKGWQDGGGTALAQAGYGRSFKRAVVSGKKAYLQMREEKGDHWKEVSIGGPRKNLGKMFEEGSMFMHAGIFTSGSMGMGALFGRRIRYRRAVRKTVRKTAAKA